MKRKLLSAGLFVMLIGFVGLSQSTGNQGLQHRFAVNKGTPTMTFSAPDMTAIRLEDEQRDRNGQYYRIGVAAFTNITTQNAGSWVTKPNGDRVWQLHIRFAGAEALSFLFQTFKIYDDSYLNIYNTSGEPVADKYTKEDVREHFMRNIPLCFGDEMTLQLTEPAGSQASEILIDRIMYNYRSTGNPNLSKINESESCEINVNCSPTGDTWQDEKRGVARIYVVDGANAGFCSGSLVNNTAQDCKPLFLTAQHCGVGISASDYLLWDFAFAYEAVACTNPATVGQLLAASKRIDGCVLLSKSDGVSGNTITSSDFLLVHLGTLANEATTVTKLKTAAINAYWNGWDANNVANTAGSGIHHPAGDIKKISTYTGALVSATYSGTPNTHWRVVWTSNTNGHGVTEGGSSGSPIFNTNGGNSRIIGTLSGGSSFCTQLNGPDLYGKMSYHWTSNGAASTQQVKPFLDPGNTGVLVLNGSSDPCTVVVPVAPVAEFSGSPTTVNVGGLVQFTDLSSNTPTSWAWSITPATGWSYANGTNANSQNPQVTFATQGQYTVALTATNAQGSDVETKTNYITVTLATGPCTASSTICDEYISNVLLGTLNNTTACANQSYSNTTSMNKGQQYTVTLTTGQAYIDDEVAVYIDWNADLDFNDAGERVAYALIVNGWNNVFNFTAPLTAVTGTVNMRVRMSYNGADNPDGPITPCGTTEFGEVEDYTVTILPAVAGLDELSVFNDVSIFPNPTSNQLSVDLSAITGSVSVELIDITGKVLARQLNVAGTIAQFDMSGFAKGSYQVRMNNGNVSLTQRVIKL